MLHFERLERELRQIIVKFCVLDELRDDVFEGSATVGVDLCHVSQYDVDAPSVSLVKSYVQRSYFFLGRFWFRSHLGEEGILRLVDLGLAEVELVFTGFLDVVVMKLLYQNRIFVLHIF